MKNYSDLLATLISNKNIKYLNYSDSSICDLIMPELYSQNLRIEVDEDIEENIINSLRFGNFNEYVKKFEKIDIAVFFIETIELSNAIQEVLCDLLDRLQKSNINILLMGYMELEQFTNKRFRKMFHFNEIQKYDDYVLYCS